MLFEKPNLKRPISLDLVGLVCVVVIVTAYITYGAIVISEIVNVNGSSSKITILDLINGIAQIATASAFVLAYVQFRKNRIQQRQVIIATEATSQLEKMISVINEMELGEKTDLKSLNKSISLLSNLATNFDELFKAMSEDIQKAIVRMQWQDMYFNYLSHALRGIDPVVILKKEASIDEAVLENAVTEAKRESEENNILPVFKEYVFTEKLLSHPDIKPKYSLGGKIDTLDMFVSHYLNDHNLNDLMYGLLSRIDIRAHAPLLAVAGPSEWALKKST
ncbi:hypothetical protein [Vibrio litoralis]|uniref:hypothetical protein n=1 Tax=Vibrio litoralis TaxID=335972 RepID=UPI0004037BFE|nr:hypothetical protein [Vibrio litoralis]